MPRAPPRSHRLLPTHHRFNLLNKEFTFTIDTSNLPCGLNGALYFVEMQRRSRHATPYLTAPLPHISGALYFVEMQKDGGVSEYSTNEASNCREPPPSPDPIAELALRLTPVQVQHERGGRQVRHRLLRRAVPARHQVDRRQGEPGGLEPTEPPSTSAATLPNTSPLMLLRPHPVINRRTRRTGTRRRPTRTRAAASTARLPPASNLATAIACSRTALAATNGTR